MTADKRYVMVVDTAKCVGCKACVLACEAENNVPEGFCRSWVVEETTGVFPELRQEIRSERCNQCSDAPCAEVCPTGATHVAEGGVVMIDRDKCTGCKACVASCPYDARFVHPEGFVDKCTFCLHRVRRGEDPACVSVCPTRSLHFGDANDPGSEVAVLLRTRKSKVLHPEAGTQPNVHFLE